MTLNLPSADMVAIERALSVPRFSRYLAQTRSDGDSALQLYDWNARVSAAFLHPVHIFEVALRNGVVAAIEAEYGAEWHLEALFIGSLPHGGGGSYGPREDLRAATAKVQRELSRIHPQTSFRVPAGKVVAELKFMFWISMLTARHDRKLWASHLSKGFPFAPVSRPGILLPQRRLYAEAEAVRKFRNRIAHYEPIFDRDLRVDYARILRVVRWRCHRTAAWLNRNQLVATLLRERP